MYAVDYRRVTVYCLTIRCLVVILSSFMVECYLFGQCIARCLLFVVFTDCLMLTFCCLPLSLIVDRLSSVADMSCFRCLCVIVCLMLSVIYY